MNNKTPPPPDPLDYGLNPDTIVSSRWERGTAYFTVRSCTWNGTDTGETHEVRWASPPPYDHHTRRGLRDTIRRVLR